MVGTKDYHILDHKGYKIGIIGLAEKEWIDTLPCFEPKDLIYTPFVKVAKDLTKFLSIFFIKSKENEKSCDLVIALTHFRTPNDIKLCEEVQELDATFGGHDHVKIIF